MPSFKMWVKNEVSHFTVVPEAKTTIEGLSELLKEN